MKTPSVISPQALGSLCSDRDPVLLDVRTPAEFEEVSIEGARLVPLESFRADEVSAELGTKDEPVFLICASGKRAEQAYRKLESSGFSEAVILENGMSGWLAGDLPVRRGKKIMPLERQVRIFAGAVAFCGALLGWSIHPLFHGLSAIVGMGMVYAGLTDSCGLGLLVAKMPWNQRGGSASVG